MHSSLRSLLGLGAVVAILGVSSGVSAAPTQEGGDFDRQAASTALSSVDLVKCKTTNAPRGDGHVFVTFAPGGTATAATLDKGPMVKTPVAKCIVAQFMKAKVPGFKGAPVQVGKTFHFE